MSEVIQITPEVDNLYLDMNGIVHNCVPLVNEKGGDEQDMFVECFRYIGHLFSIIKPKKLLYMAIDGVAPRAKMNQQRSRRFRSANDAREARAETARFGNPPTADTPKKSSFDRNAITPGTEFMARLSKHLNFFVMKKVQEDPLWAACENIVLSGPECPGEGEHKIME